jgi:hypothetical protein
MRFFGQYTTHDVEGSNRLKRLHNPVGPELWGAELDDGHILAPCDNFISDLSSSPRIFWAIYPPFYGEKAAFIHDWIRHVHVVTREELMIELKEWFDAMAWTDKQREEYVDWLKSITFKQWNELYYQLSILCGVRPTLARFTWAVLSVFAIVPWNSKPTYRTKIYREKKEVKI